MGFEKFTSVDLSARWRGHEEAPTSGARRPLQNFMYIAAGKSQIHEGPPSMEVPGENPGTPAADWGTTASLHGPFQGLGHVTPLVCEQCVFLQTVATRVPTIRFAWV